MKPPNTNTDTTEASAGSDTEQNGAANNQVGGHHINGHAPSTVANGQVILLNHQNQETQNGGQLSGQNDVADAHEEAVFRAIDDACASHEETYEELLQSFTFFRPGDAHPGTNPVASGCISVPVDRRSDATGHNTSQQGPKGTVTADQTDDESVSARTAQPNLNEDGETIEEEILAQGTRVSVLTGQESGGRGCLVKFDNFVQEEEDDGSEQQSQYHSSWDGTRVTLPQTTREDLPSGLESGLYSIAKQKANTLKHKADPENEKFEILDDVAAGFLDGENSCESSDEELSYDPEFDRPNPGEVTEDPGEELPPLVRNIQTLEYSGKAAEQDSQPTELKDLLQHPSNPSEDCDPTCTYDEVEDFTLDENFDYDSVTLTPKYTRAEMDIMQGIIRLGPVYPQAPSYTNDDDDLDSEEPG